MKPGLILKPEGWHLIERLPEEPKKTCAGKPFCCEGRRCDHLAYQEALQQAIDGAILVGNQDKPEVRDLIWRLWSHSPEGGVTVQKGKVYPVEVEYEISEEPEYPIDHTSYPPYGKVAILHPKQKNKLI
jgi:hypothetical protein